MVSFLLGPVIGIVVWNVALDINHERKHAIFAIRRSLEIGMPPDEVKDVLHLHRAPFLTVNESENGITVDAHLGAADFCGLLIGFREGRLVSAVIRGEDGSHDVFPDGPPDLLATDALAAKAGSRH